VARKPDPDARDRILDIASRLFDQHGVRAVGLQQIIDECGCGKNLLYREFGSKDELVAAYLERCRQDWSAILDQGAAAAPGDPAGQLVAIVAIAAEQATTPGYRGCSLHNAHAEFPETDHAASEVLAVHFTGRRQRLQEIAQAAGAQDPLALADRILLILDGLSANGATMGRHGPATAAVAFAEDVIKTSLR